MVALRIPVIITRAEPGASETAARVEALGAEPVLAPVLRLQSDPDVPLPDLKTLSGLVFTSANGVRVFAERETDRTLTAWCVGPATATAAREADFTDVRESAGNAVDLAEFIGANSYPSEQPLLHVANAAAKGDLKAELERLGFAVQFAPLYHMQSADALPEAALQLIAQDAPAIVLIHSAKGAERCAALCKELSTHQVTAVAISAPASAPLASLRLAGLRIADAPNEDSLLSALEAVIATLSA